MTCPHCAFENIESDEARCFRCGQDLDLSNVDVEPLRLRRGPSPWLTRRFGRFWNLLAPRPEHAQGRPLLAAALSFVPGLGHYVVLADPRRALFVLGTWISTMITAIYLDPPLSWALGDLATWAAQPHWLVASTHAWIACDAYQVCVRQDGRKAHALELSLISTLSITLLYAFPLLALAGEAGDRAAGYVRLEVQQTVIDVNIRQGDVLVVRQHAYNMHLRRGMVVLYYPPTAQHIFGSLVGTVQAVGGDIVEWQHSKQRFVVNGTVVDAPSFIRNMWRDHPDSMIQLATDQIFIFPAFGEVSTVDMFLSRSTVNGVAVRIQDPPSRRRSLI